MVAPRSWKALTNPIEALIEPSTNSLKPLVDPMKSRRMLVLALISPVRTFS